MKSSGPTGVAGGICDGVSPGVLSDANQMKIKHYCDQRGLIAPPGLVAAHGLVAPELDSLRYEPGLGGDCPPSLDWALRTAERTPWPLPDNLVPLLPVDDSSFACVVAATPDRPDLVGAGAVVRWHLDAECEEHQATLLDTSADVYAQSVVDELRARQTGLARVLDEIGPAYEFNFLDRSERPRGYVVRPVRIACQNVIVGLAAFAQDSGIDGMSVVAWQTCEVPHVATHEGNRALCALMLCDAFQRGGTMEIRFDRPAQVAAQGVTKAGEHLKIDVRYKGHPEMKVPASLRRYGRTVGVALGAEDPASISPAEARELFLAVTRMPKSLQRRATRMIDRGVISAERLCYSLLAGVWREIELDFLLAVSSRAASILTGGSNWWDRSARQAESEVCRAAVMLGMLFRRLDATDAAAADGIARLIEDKKAGITWQVLDETGAVRFQGLTPGEPMPWTNGGQRVNAPELTVLARSIGTSTLVVQATEAAGRGPTAIVVPSGAPVPPLPESVLVLRCPDRLGDIDKTVESNLARGRLSSV